MLNMVVPANYANDATATTGGVPVGGVYRNVVSFKFGNLTKEK